MFFRKSKGDSGKDDWMVRRKGPNGGAGNAVTSRSWCASRTGT